MVRCGWLKQNVIMETRTIQQVLIHKLIMNPMNARTEESNLVAWSTERNNLINWYNNEKEIDVYTDVQENYGFENEVKNWRKTFKKGSHLEWYNPLYNFEEVNHYGQGFQVEWVNEELLQNIESRFLRIT